jgi:hypothetical protein
MHRRPLPTPANAVTAGNEAAEAAEALIQTITEIKTSLVSLQVVRAHATVPGASSNSPTRERPGYYSTVTFTPHGTLSYPLVGQNRQIISACRLQYVLRA